MDIGQLRRTSLCGPVLEIRKPNVKPNKSNIAGSGGSALRWLLILTSLTLVLNVLLLRAPAPPPGTESQYCVRVTQLGYGFRIIENCDSGIFLTLARRPSLLLTNKRENQLW